MEANQCMTCSAKKGIATTIAAAAMTAGAITGAVIVGGMGIAAASVALIVASVVLGIFTLISGGGTGVELFLGFDGGHIESMRFLLVDFIGEFFKENCCCCKSKEKTIV